MTMQLQGFDAVVLNAWQATAQTVANQTSNFLGQKKETLVFQHLRKQIQAAQAGVGVVGPQNQERFNNWSIDLVGRHGGATNAIEGKFKLVSDSATPDNRKAAFFDLYKLEHYVDSGKYTKGLFLWLTNEPGYRRAATGDSVDFSTHQGRSYTAGTPLNANRSRDTKMPLPLVLTRDYTFNWQQIISGSDWYSLVLIVTQVHQTVLRK